MPSDPPKPQSPALRADLARRPPPQGVDMTLAARALKDRIAFVRGFVANPAEVGSVVPSSGFLEHRLVRAAHLGHARTVVELGPGTGGTTRALLRAMRPDARLLAIELSPAFHRRLAQQVSDARLFMQHGSAESLAEYLEAWRLPAPDVVISGIPFSTMPPPVARRIGEAITASLAPGGRFVAYQVRAHVAMYLTPLLGTPSIDWEWRNVPPMRVFRWIKPAA